ncbi:hypothetical protein DDE18_20635 [Nocardioides gansuensis]|uniref:Blue (type 1) copper domain-containing protein n=1 Tax=Nocardioides gansuensis TaxID=2138300 RepID=A0A2T8F5L3_9ACTN|nr:hypothetical protein DDE18_20635 [Nocardioides gansuensis]
MLVVALLLSAGLAACTPEGGGRSGPAPDDGSQRRDVLLDQGSADVVDLRPVTVQARPGDVVVLHSGNPGHGGDDESPVHHLFTSAPADSPPPLFVAAGRGHLPNPGSWGMCRGGDPARATGGCPIPPVEGPSAYDGRSYFSLGALLPGETRELPLAPDLPPGTYRFTCTVHPDMYVDIEVVEDPTTAAPLPPAEVAAARQQVVPHTTSGPGRPVVLLGPQPAGSAAEVLTAVPGAVRVPVGGAVTWRVDDRSPHTVELGLDHPPHLADTTATDTAPAVPRGRRWDGTGTVRSGVLSADPSVDRTTFSLVFTRPGTYRAYDRFHAGIKTVVQVG